MNCVGRQRLQGFYGHFAIGGIHVLYNYYYSVVMHDICGGFLILEISVSIRSMPQNNTLAGPVPGKLTGVVPAIFGCHEAW